MTEKKQRKARHADMNAAVDASFGHPSAADRYSGHVVVARHAARRRRNPAIAITSAFASLVAVAALAPAPTGMNGHEMDSASNAIIPSSLSLVSRDSIREPLSGSGDDKSDGKANAVHSQSADEKRAVSALRKAVDDGRSSLDGSNGRVDDEDTRIALQQSVDDADNVLKGVDDSTEIDVASFDAKAQAVSNAMAVVNASMDSLNRKQAAAQAAAEEQARAQAAAEAQRQVEEEAARQAQAAATTASTGEMQQWFHDWLISNGYTEDDFSAGMWIINHESSWEVHATNPSSGAYGLAQALPGSKMASAGADWHDNYQTQLKWFVAYCTSRYGGISNARDFWVANHYY